MKNILLRIAIILIISGVTSCQTAMKPPKGKQVFRYNESAGISSLDPAFARDQANIGLIINFIMV